jgi:hypothetical protein
MSEDDQTQIVCPTHGKRIGALVCCHMLAASDRVVGFVENSADPDDLQAWCYECEQVFLAEGGLTDAFERFNDRKVVCSECYATLKARHERP